MSIRLQFSRQADPISSAIAWFTQGDLSHVDAVLPSGSLLGARSDKVGGIRPGVRMRPPHYTEWALTVTFEIPCTEAQALDFWGFLYNQIGKPYDTSAIWGFVFGRDWREQDSWICSELQAAALEHAGIAQPLYLTANKISPNSLCLLVSALPGATRITQQDDQQPGHKAEAT